MGLIINELISYSLEYAFNEAGNGEIYEALKENNNLLLQVKVNGCDFAHNLSKAQHNSFG